MIPFLHAYICVLVLFGTNMFSEWQRYRNRFSTHTHVVKYLFCNSVKVYIDNNRAIHLNKCLNPLRGSAMAAAERLLCELTVWWDCKRLQTRVFHKLLIYGNAHTQASLGLHGIGWRKYLASNGSPTDNQRPEVSGPSWPQDRRASGTEDHTSRWWMDAFTLTPQPGSGEDQIAISGNRSCKHATNGGSQQVRSTVFACLSTQNQQLDHGLQHETPCERFSTAWSTTICKIPRRAITLSKRKSNKRPQNGESSGEATKRSRQSRYERFLERGATPGQLPRFGWKSKEDNHRSEGSTLSWSKAPDERCH